MKQEPKIVLSLEQEFNLKSFEAQIKSLSSEQSKVLLSEIYRQLLLREAYFKHFIKQNVL